MQVGTPRPHCKKNLCRLMEQIHFTEELLSRKYSFQVCLISPYNGVMSAHVIANPVPSPEEMGQILGLSPERVAALRSIMSAPSGRKSSRGVETKFSFRRPSRSRASSKVRGKR